MKLTPRIQLTVPVEEILRTMTPAERKTIVGVIRLMDNDGIRNVRKRNLYLPGDEQKPTWQFSESIVWLAFVEEDDGKIMVVHASLVSKFRRA